MGCKLIVSFLHLICFTRATGPSPVHLQLSRKRDRNICRQVTSFEMVDDFTCTESPDIPTPPFRSASRLKSYGFSSRITNLAIKSFHRSLQLSKFSIYTKCRKNQIGYCPSFYYCFARNHRRNAPTKYSQRDTRMSIEQILRCSKVISYNWMLYYCTLQSTPQSRAFMVLSLQNDSVKNCLNLVLYLHGITISSKFLIVGSSIVSPTSKLVWFYRSSIIKR